MSEIALDAAEKLARMAGQIADFYKPYPDEVAVREIATHINKFWSRAMRASFLATFPPQDARLDPRINAARALIKPA